MLQGTAWSLVSQGWKIGGGSSGTLSSSVPLHVMVGRYYWLQRCWWRLALPAAAVHLATRSADLGFTGAGSRVRVPALCTRTLAAHWGTRTRDLAGCVYMYTGLGNPTHVRVRAPASFGEVFLLFATCCRGSGPAVERAAVLVLGLARA